MGKFGDDLLAEEQRLGKTFVLPVVVVEGFLIGGCSGVRVPREGDDVGALARPEGRVVKQEVSVAIVVARLREEGPGASLG